MVLQLRSRVRILLGLVLLVLGMVLVATPARAAERTLLVPQDYPTIQAAVDDSAEGDTILVDRGVYNEQVFVDESHPGITIRGVDRNEVILDGNNEMAIGVFVKAADNVRVENMTAREYTGNGFYWQSVEGYVGRYLTAYHIGVYGIYAFDSRLGLFEESYASGSSDSSFYIGQCFPCDATIRNVVGEYSIIGYSGTNAGGNLAIKDSLWNLNGAGIVPNSLDSEAYPPQRQAIISGNTVTDSGKVPVPAKGVFEIADGLGIIVAGGVGNIIENNVVTDSKRYGIVITPMPSENVWQPKDNVVRNNEVSGSGWDDPVGADLSIVAGSDSGNCFEGNTFETSDPPQIEDAWTCGDSLSSAPGAGSPVSATNLILSFGEASACEEGLDPACSEHPAYSETPVPPAQKTMPADEAGKGVPGGPAEQEAAAAAEAELDVTVPREAPDVSPAQELPTTGGGIVAMLAGAVALASGFGLRRRDG